MFKTIFNARNDNAHNNPIARASVSLSRFSPQSIQRRTWDIVRQAVPVPPPKTSKHLITSGRRGSAFGRTRQQHPLSYPSLVCLTQLPGLPCSRDKSSWRRPMTTTTRVPRSNRVNRGIPSRCPRLVGICSDSKIRQGGAVAERRIVVETGRGGWVVFEAGMDYVSSP